MPWTKETFETTKNSIQTTILSDLEISTLLAEYPFTKNKDLAVRYSCSNSFLLNFARYYSIKKDKEWLKTIRAETLINRNKNITGRDLTYELLQEIALKYQSKREFSEKDCSAYVTANRLGIMDEITKHMISFAFSVPQIITRQITEYLFFEKCEYNTRRIIPPYELDVYFPNLKLAFEYDGKGWHKNDEIDKIKLCKDKGILLIKIFERSRRFKEDIQNHLVENLDLINEWCNTNITSNVIFSFNEDIDFPKLFTEEELNLLRSNSVKYLRKYNNILYEKYKRYNPDNINFTNIKWTLEVVTEEMKQYSSMKDIYRNNKNLYQVIHKKFKHLIHLYDPS